MASASQTISASRAGIFTGRNSLLDRYFYFAMSLLIAAIVVWGFSHTIEQNLFHPAVPRPPILWFHAAAFSLWVAFYIFQSTLVRTRNVKWHRFFGWFGTGLATAMVVLGTAAAIVMGRFDIHRLHESGVEGFLIDPLYDMAVFAILIALAIYWRKKPEFHRRLMFVATCCLLDAAFGRIDYLYNHNLYFPCLDGVIALGIVRDLLVNRRIHKVYFTALPVLMVCQFFVIYTWRSGAGWWLRIAHALLG